MRNTPFRNLINHTRVYSSLVKIMNLNQKIKTKSIGICWHDDIANLMQESIFWLMTKRKGKTNKIRFEAFLRCVQGDAATEKIKLKMSAQK